MNRITELLDLEDSDIVVSDIRVEGRQKTLTLETPPAVHYCPQCGFRMHSRGIKMRRISHPILQDGYELLLLLNSGTGDAQIPTALMKQMKSSDLSAKTGV
jgi:transposase